MTDHAEMVLLHRAGSQLQTMDDQCRRKLTVYVTLKPCLMCSAALSFVGIKRIVYAALAEDANDEQMIVRGPYSSEVKRSASARTIHFSAGCATKAKDELYWSKWQKPQAMQPIWKLEHYALASH
jgi:tRNA(Arg) A34 adenosine deaminase TadA